MNALRAGAYGIPFIPVNGMLGSDLVDLRPEFFRSMESPFDGQKTVVVKALVPDYAIIHVQEADEYGNARILGPDFQDVLLARAAQKTIITTEKLVNTDVFRHNPKMTAVPHFLVEAVVLAPGGAKPGICYQEYDHVEDREMRAYIQAVKDDTIKDFFQTITERRIQEWNMAPQK
ncbi:MAG: CoA transferase subunit A [Syntrophomonadaceae bacterium]